VSASAGARETKSMLYTALLLLACRNNYRTHSLSASEATLGRPPAPCSRIIIIFFLLHSLSDGHTFVHNNWPHRDKKHLAGAITILLKQAAIIFAGDLDPDISGGG
jgi:hypothetical protein